MDLPVEVSWKCLLGKHRINTVISVPSGITSIVLLLFTIPQNFPFHGLPASRHQPLALKQRFSKSQLSRLDLVGTILLLSATVFLVTALEEAGTRYDWNSAFTIIVLVITASSWALFLAWSRRLSHQGGAQEAVFPWRLAQSRVCLGLLG